MKFIINADDFGRNHERNVAVVEAFKLGYISNATIMVNMPGFEEAVNLAKQNGFFDKIGLHLNFYDGVPLTDSLKKDKFFSKNGVLTSKIILNNHSLLHRVFLPNKTRKALAEECKAQLDKFFDAGFSQKHFDSHGHSHTLPAVYFSIRKNISIMETTRLSLNLYKKRNFVISLYKVFINYIIKKNFNTTSYFTSSKELFNVDVCKYSDLYSCEIMTHPIMNNGILENSNSIGFEELIGKTGNNLVSFNDFKESF